MPDFLNSMICVSCFFFFLFVHVGNILNMYKDKSQQPGGKDCSQGCGCLLPPQVNNRAETVGPFPPGPSQFPSLSTVLSFTACFVIDIIVETKSRRLLNVLWVQYLVQGYLCSALKVFWHLPIWPEHLNQDFISIRVLAQHILLCSHFQTNCLLGLYRFSVL